MADQSQESSDKNVEIWKIKKLIKSLEAARGNGTSMISLIIPPRDQIPRIAKMLADEYGTASNIKSRVNRLSVLSAITSVQARLKLYNKVPNNGLVIYCGTIVTDDGKEKKVNIDFEPFKPINTSLYLCDNKFHTEVRCRPVGKMFVIESLGSASVVGRRFALRFHHHGRQRRVVRHVARQRA